MWLTATIAFVDGVVRISTSEREIVFRLRRLSWVGPDRIMVSGLDSHGRVQRSALRFATLEEANQAVSAIKDLGIVELQQYTPPEEVFCQIRMVVPKEFLLVLIAWLLPALTALVIAQVAPRAPIGLVFLSLFVITVLLRRLWLPRLLELTLRSNNPLLVRTLRGSLRSEGERLFLLPSYYPIASTNLEWKSRSEFVLASGRMKFNLVFSTPEDAVKAARLVKTTSPQVQETWTTNP